MTDVKVAACQLPYVHEDVERALTLIAEYAIKAEAQGARLICFPECYLQGYVFDEETTERLALDLSSLAFDGVLRRLAHLKSILIIGLIEKEGTYLYNTAIVISGGRVLGRYRKVKLLKGERLFKAGDEYPVFEVDGLRFGINICNDLNFPECARMIADQGARLLVCPCNNMMRKDNAEIWKDQHNEIRSHRAVETGLWLISSDVTGARNGRISYGPTALISPEGSVVQQVKLLQAGLIWQGIMAEPSATDRLKP